MTLEDQIRDLVDQSARTKRTYNLPRSVVATVRELASEYHVAPTQDAVIEMAVERLARSVRDERDAAAWEAAATDPAFVQESDRIAAEFRSADLEQWPE